MRAPRVLFPAQRFQRAPRQRRGSHTGLRFSKRDDGVGPAEPLDALLALDRTTGRQQLAAPVPLPAPVSQSVPELPPRELARALAPVDAVVRQVRLHRVVVAEPLEALGAVRRGAARPDEARVAADAHLRPAAVPQTVPDLPELGQLVDRHADAAAPRWPRLRHARATCARR